MRLRDAADLRTQGFSGFIGFDRIRLTPTEVPVSQGVYAVVAPADFVNDFSAVGTGGHFKGVDPNVSIPTLAKNWVAASQILYFGLAGAGAKGRRGLRKRLSEYASFGQGRPIGHKGGRYIWQLRNSADLLVSWKVTEEDPAVEERALLRAFHEEHGSLPFANLRF